MSWEGWVWPVAITDGREPVISDKYQLHESADHRMHTGVDILFKKRPGDPRERVKHTASLLYIAPQGTKILAAGPGKIWSTGSSERGLNILVDHGNVPGFGPMTTWYQHLASFSRNWRKGDVVRPGAVLGDMGYPTTDGEQLRHLHFEVRNPTSPIDPAPYLRLWRKTAASSSEGTAPERGDTAPQRGSLVLPLAIGGGFLLVGLLVASAAAKDDLV